VLSLFLTTGPLVACIVAFGLPPGADEELALGGLVQILVGFGIAAAWLARAPDAAHRPRPVMPGGIE
jgi:hypothetical protein